MMRTWLALGFVPLLTALTARPDELKAMGRHGRDWMSRDFSWQKAAALLHQFYASLHHVPV